MTEDETADRFAEAIRDREQRRYRLRLYVVGATPGSQRAISNFKEICESELASRYELEVIDNLPATGTGSRSADRRRPHPDQGAPAPGTEAGR